MISIKRYTLIILIVDPYRFRTLKVLLIPKSASATIIFTIFTIFKRRSISIRVAKRFFVVLYSSEGWSKRMRVAIDLAMCQLQLVGRIRSTSHIF